jgi:hypothetical protein
MRISGRSIPARLCLILLLSAFLFSLSLPCLADAAPANEQTTTLKQLSLEQLGNIQVTTMRCSRKFNCGMKKSGKHIVN